MRFGSEFWEGGRGAVGCSSKFMTQATVSLQCPVTCFQRIHVDRAQLGRNVCIFLPSPLLPTQVVVAKESALLRVLCSAELR
jgi:hypothetical protein